MINTATKIKVKWFWSNYNTTIILVLLLIIFLSYAMFIALNLKTGIVPDEERHFLVSKQFSKTFGIPPDVPDTLKMNMVIKQNPYLYYWINGRVINIIDFIFPPISDWQLLVSLRIVNVLYGLGTVIFCYFFSTELIHHKWWQLLPVFLLTNTIMFVFLTGGVNDDNLTHLVCVAALYFLSRIFNHQAFVTNSIAMLISLASCTLIKHRVFPFVFAVGVAWIAFFVKNIKNILPLKINGKKTVFLFIILLILIIGNLGIYGYNLLVYHSYLPLCEDILSNEQCDLRLLYFEERPPEYKIGFLKGWDYKLTISESIDRSFPGPINYFLTNWVPLMLMRTFGILGHRYHYAIPATILHLVLFNWLVLITIIYWRDFSFNILGFLGIFIFYSATLFLYIYRYELLLRFNNGYIQGRYMFSVIDIAFVFATKVLKDLPRKTLRISTLIFMMIFYFFSGPLTFILKFSSSFSDWFIL
ncbi:MAG: hypothetical protein ACTSQ8_20905 [Candidatus Helarchaeota archaeon]